MNVPGYTIGFAIVWQLVWLMVVSSAPTALAPAGVLGGVAMLVVHLACAGRRALVELRTLAVAVAIGVAGDSALSLFDLVGYAPDPQRAGPAPLWILLLWAWFAVALHHPLGFLRQRLWLAALLGAVAGPLAYAGGAALDAVVFFRPWAAPLAVGALYALGVPALALVARCGIACRETAEEAAHAA